MTNFNTDEEEIINFDSSGEDRISSVIAVDIETAEKILDLLGLTYPPVEDLRELHLIIKH